MNTYPLIGVIIPTFNSKSTILKTIASVRNQTYRNYEIIIVDDGSTNGTVELLTGLRDIKLFTQTNQGVALPEIGDSKKLRGTI